MVCFVHIISDWQVCFNVLWQWMECFQGVFNFILNTEIKRILALQKLNDNVTIVMSKIKAVILLSFQLFFSFQMDPPVREQARGIQLKTWALFKAVKLI